MASGNKFVALAKGGLLGAAVGAVTAVLVAPKSGEQLQQEVNDRIREAKIAGENAKAAKQVELIERYRLGVDSSAALETSKIDALQTAVTKTAAINQGSSS
jgi:gas vesicle protein